MDSPTLPNRNPCSFGRDSSLCHLKEDSGRLFSSSKVDVEAWCWDDCQKVTTSSITGEPSLQATLEGAQLASDVFFILKQQNTYSSLNLTVDILLKIFKFCDFSHSFLDFVHGFGRKSCDLDEGFNCHYRHPTSPRSYEFCYNIRYAARNGRSSGNPWSIRHTAVCERYDDISKTTRWVLIQPSDDFKVQALEYMESSPERPNAPGLHVLMMLSSATNWWKYVNYLEISLKALEEKALFSRVETFTPGDYELTFSDIQGIQHLRKKLLKLQAILEASLDLAAGFKDHILKISDGNQPSLAGEAVISMAQKYTAQLHSHRRTCSMLLEHSKGISKLLFQILQKRNDDILVKNNKVMAEATIGMSHTNKEIYNNGKVMEQLTRAAGIETDAINRLARESLRDSRFVKILTFVALLYLPASLIATIFSSGLVEKEARGQFALAVQFWMFPVFTFALLVLTVVVAVLWYRLSHRDFQ